MLKRLWRDCIRMRYSAPSLFDLKKLSSIILCLLSFCAEFGGGLVHTFLIFSAILHQLITLCIFFKYERLCGPYPSRFSCKDCTWSDLSSYLRELRTSILSSFLRKIERKIYNNNTTNIGQEQRAPITSWSLSGYTWLPRRLKSAEVVCVNLFYLRCKTQSEPASFSSPLILLGTFFWSLASGFFSAPSSRPAPPTSSGYARFWVAACWPEVSSRGLSSTGWSL